MKYFIVSTLIMLILCLQACGKKVELAHIDGFAQGTTYHITFVSPGDIDQDVITQAVTAEFTRLDKEISNYRADSTIEQFNALLSTEPQQISEEIVSLIEIARRVSKASSGCYDLTIKPLFELWGFKKDKFNLPSDLLLQQTLTQVGMDKLETLDKDHIRKTQPELRIDLSSIGQGYSVNRIAGVLESNHIKNYLVEIGGELKTRGKKTDGSPWRIALEKPLPNERKLEKIVVFKSGEPYSLMASGTYRHYFDNDGKRYSHILDARSGKPVEHSTVAVTVLHSDPTIADAWSTALLCMGSEEGIKIADENGIAALYIDQEGDKLIERNTRALEQTNDIVFEEINGK